MQASLQLEDLDWIHRGTSTEKGCRTKKYAE